ncbi:hypothetical protein C8J57DRAFT_1668213 [Mycena rebaudengoi]|nr:hypothetical protein C8J57DRAFT_1668213 [Mycena rebaudengoi]
MAEPLIPSQFQLILNRLSASAEFGFRPLSPGSEADVVQAHPTWQPLRVCFPSRLCTSLSSQHIHVAHMVPPETDRSRPTPDLATHTSCRTGLTRCPRLRQAGTTYADNGPTLAQHPPHLPPLHHRTAAIICTASTSRSRRSSAGASSRHIRPSLSPGDDVAEDDGTPTPSPTPLRLPRPAWTHRLGQPRSLAPLRLVGRHTPADIHTASTLTRHDAPAPRKRTQAPLDSTNTPDAPRPHHPARLGYRPCNWTFKSYPDLQSPHKPPFSYAK